MESGSQLILLGDRIDLAVHLEADILTRQNFELVVVNNGQQALTMMEQLHPVLIVLETTMPGVSGMDCCKAIKANEHWKQIPLVLLVSDENLPQDQLEERVSQCFGANCDEVLVHPLTQAQVVSKISHILGLQTRNLARLHLEIPVNVLRDELSLSTTAINMNREGMLVTSEVPFEAGVNYVLSFALGANDPNLRVWGRLQKTIAPGEGRNTGNKSLCLFRFLDLPERVAQRIDQLAELQNLQTAGKAKPAAPAKGGLSSVLAALQKPSETYIALLTALAQNAAAQPAGCEEQELAVARQMLQTLTGWEKQCLASTGVVKTNDFSGDQTSVLVVRKTIGARCKFLIDLKRLQSLPLLTEAQQNELRTIQAAYFQESSRPLNKLQEIINERMRTGGLEEMKALNQSKTDTFRSLVAVKSTLNRLLDPRAAAAAEQYHYQADSEDRPQAATFERTKVLPEEKEKPKKQAVVVPEARQGSRHLRWILLVILWGVVFPAALWFSQNLGLFIKSDRAQNIQLNLKSGLPIKKTLLNEAQKELFIFATPEWDRHSRDEKEQILKKTLQEVGEKKFNTFVIYSEKGRLLGSGDVKSGIFKLYN